MEEGVEEDPNGGNWRWRKHFRSWEAVMVDSRTGGNGGSGSNPISISGSAVIYGVGGRGADSGIFNAAVSGAPNTGNGARGGGTASLA